jgi:glutathione S-transferase
MLMGEEAANQLGDDFPNVTAWMERMKARPEVAKVMREKQEALAAMMAQGN